ncbi:NUDIX hydrolase [Peloplasma aerotolerans]|uniref:8-oxo-dGTP diphosphatase n=1 Tax=Peloplasma aerotolerans TaxID=3044389 RepID=A0AAW6UC06_9MOLU|nr:8-oxo-dGTP diphosphatase [Mariniplasma sp. M4Ah]MDI6453174.1 8-oxo-dGTP diphosphatase [Mariniplasma sp. M4Ah]
MYKYTLGFIKRKDEVLMLNREKNPWKGCWNGLGGKVDAHESMIDCIQREIMEETSIDLSVSQFQDKGVLTWNTFDALGQGLHIYLIEVADDFIYPTPQVVSEGILDWKKIEWLSDTENYGVAHNIPYFLPTVIHDQNRYHYHCTFNERILISVTKERMI